MLFMEKESGQGLVEYAMLVAFVAIVLLAIVAVLGERIQAMYNTIISKLPFG